MHSEITHTVFQLCFTYAFKLQRHHHLCFGRSGLIQSQLESALMTLQPSELLLVEPLSPQTERMLASYLASTSGCRMERVPFNAAYSDAKVVGAVSTFYSDEAGGADAAGTSHGRQQGLGNVGGGGGGGGTGGFAGSYGGGGSNPNVPGHSGGSADVSAASASQQLKGTSGPAAAAVDCSNLETVLQLPSVVLRALAAAIDYLKAFHLEGVLRLAGAFRPLEVQREMTLSPNALRQLDILTAGEEGAKLVGPGQQQQQQ